MTRTLSLRLYRAIARRVAPLALPLGLALAAAPAHGSIAITEFIGNASGSDTNREWIELFNYGPDPVRLAGWSFATDNAGSAVALPDVVLESGGFLIYTDDKTTFQNEWLGGVADARVHTAGTFDLDNGSASSPNADYPRILSPIDNDNAWSVVTNYMPDGYSVYWSENDFNQQDHGNFTDNSNFDPVDYNGSADVTGRIGYESNEFNVDPLASTSTNGDVGSPLAGNYTAHARTVVSLTDSGTPYTQDFDSLGNTDDANYAALNGSNPLPDGWRTFEADGGFNSAYRAENGDNGSGNSLSLGADGSTDRALGTLRTGNNFGMYFGAVFRNDGTEAIDSITISFTGEQWRIGSDRGFGDVLDFALSLDAINLYDGTWLDIDALDFTSPTLGADGTALDGNLAANQTFVGPVTINFDTPIAVGEEFWIRWFDRQVSGSDDQLGIDDLTISFTTVGGVSAVPLPAALPAGALLGGLALTRRRRR